MTRPVFIVPHRAPFVIPIYFGFWTSFDISLRDVGYGSNIKFSIIIRRFRPQRCHGISDTSRGYAAASVNTPREKDACMAASVTAPPNRLPPHASELQLSGLSNDL